MQRQGNIKSDLNTIIRAGVKCNTLARVSRCVPRIVHWGGVDLEAMYNLFLILNIML
jgi:uncharacterized protein related to proFAR isomerase